MALGLQMRWFLNPRTQIKREGKEGAPRSASQAQSLAHALSCLCSGVAGNHCVPGCAEHACHPVMQEAQQAAWTHHWAELTSCRG